MVLLRTTLCVWALMASLASAQSAPVSLVGRVVDVQGGSIANAIVTLTIGGAAPRTLSSGSDGMFELENLAPGNYVLEVSAPGFVPWKQTVAVGPATPSLTVVLQVAGVREIVGVIGATTLHAPAAAASRLGLTLLETPASVQVLSGDVIRERGDTSVAEAKTRAVGMTTQATPGNGGTGTIARGFAGVGSVMQLYDGAQFFVASGTITFPFDPWTVDRIEVLGGPGSVLFGNGAIGGVVNVMPRKPNPFAHEHSARLGFGSNNTWRGAIDTTGPIGDRWSYRFDASVNRSDGWMERGRSSSTAISASLRRQVSDTLSVTLSEDYGYQEPQTYFGAPTVAGGVERARRRTNYNVGDAGIDYADNWTQLRAEWQPSANLHVRSGVHVLTSDRSWRDVELYTYRPAADLVERSSYIEIEHRQRQYGSRSDAVFNSRVGTMVNTVSAGVEYNHIRFQHENNSPYSGSSVVSLIDPTPGSFINAAGTFPKFQSRSHQLAVFAEDRLAVTAKLSLVGGFRWDRHAVDRLDLLTDVESQRTFTPVSWRGGAVYSIVPGLSLYAQYSTATDAIGNVITQSAQQQLFDLATGRQVEVGAKQSFWNGRGEWTVAGYDIVKEKLLAPVPDNPGVSQQIGQQSSRGIEASAALAIGRVRVDANGTVLRARFDDFAETIAGVFVSRAGNTPPNVPTRAANLWVTVDASDAWQARGGLRYVGARYWNNANSAHANAYAVVDAGVRRTLSRKLALDLRISNLLDTVYATTFGGNSTAPQWLLGAPRTADVSLAMTF